MYTKLLSSVKECSGSSPYSQAAWVPEEWNGHNKFNPITITFLYPFPMTGRFYSYNSYSDSYFAVPKERNNFS